MSANIDHNAEFYRHRAHIDDAAMFTSVGVSVVGLVAGAEFAVLGEHIKALPTLVGSLVFAHLGRKARNNAEENYDNAILAEMEQGLDNRGNL